MKKTLMSEKDIDYIYKITKKVEFFPLQLKSKKINVKELKNIFYKLISNININDIFNYASSELLVNGRFSKKTVDKIKNNIEKFEKGFKERFNVEIDLGNFIRSSLLINFLPSLIHVYHTTENEKVEKILIENFFNVEIIKRLLLFYQKTIYWKIKWKIDGEKRRKIIFNIRFHPYLSLYVRTINKIKTLIYGSYLEEKIRKELGKLFGDTKSVKIRKYKDLEEIQEGLKKPSADPQATKIRKYMGKVREDFNYKEYKELVKELVEKLVEKIFKEIGKNYISLPRDHLFSGEDVKIIISTKSKRIESKRIEKNIEESIIVENSETFKALMQEI